MPPIDDSSLFLFLKIKTKISGPFVVFVPSAFKSYKIYYLFWTKWNLKNCLPRILIIHLSCMPFHLHVF